MPPRTKPAAKRRKVQTSAAKPRPRKISKRLQRTAAAALARTDAQPSPGPRDHVAFARRYADQVVAGERLAGRYEVAACKRFLRDLERQRTEGFQYHLDEREASRACRFLENLPHVDGPFAKRKERFVLSPFQCFAIVNVAGWHNSTTGFRRFLRVLLLIARKNGKSFLVSGLALYFLAADGEPGAQIVSAATKRDQAAITWKVAKRMVLTDPGLRNWVGIAPLAHAIVHPKSGSTYIPLSKDDKTADGLNPYVAFLDELHAHRDRGMYDVLESAFGARDWQVLFMISTAGTDLDGICYEQVSYLQDVLDGKFADETYFGVIYSIDDGDEWSDETKWPKANPNLGISISLDVLRAEAEKAKRVPAARANFRTKRLNQWLQTDNSLFDFDKWVALGDPTLMRDQFLGKPCVIGNDLASKNDIASRVELFRIGGTTQQPKVAAFATHYTNEAYVAAKVPVAVGGWAEEGRFRVSEGDSTSQNTYERDLAAAASKYSARELAFDNYQSDGIQERMQELGHITVELAIAPPVLDQPTRRLMDMILRGDVVHDGDPVLAWMIGNVVGHESEKGKYLPKKDKKRKFRKIDGAMALLFALARMLYVPEDAPSSVSPFVVP